MIQHAPVTVTEATLDDPTTPRPAELEHMRRWIVDHAKTDPSPLGVRVAALLDAWVGLHHLDRIAGHAVPWRDAHHIAITCRLSLATHDGDLLTRLVILAHDACLRVEIAACNPMRVRLIFHACHGRTEAVSRRHATIEEAVAAVRSQRTMRHFAPISADE